MGVVSISHTPLIGGIEIYTRGGANTGGTATLTALATHSDNQKVLVTAQHVMAGSADFFTGVDTNRTDVLFSLRALTALWNRTK